MQFKLPNSVKGNGPTLRSIVEIANVLEAARTEPPLSLAELGRRLSAKRVRHATLRTTVDFLANLGFVLEGSKGVQWTFTRDRRFWEATRKGRRL